MYLGKNNCCQKGWSVFVLQRVEYCVWVRRETGGPEAGILHPPGTGIPLGPALGEVDSSLGPVPVPHPFPQESLFLRIWDVFKLGRQLITEGPFLDAMQSKGYCTSMYFFLNSGYCFKSNKKMGIVMKQVVFVSVNYLWPCFFHWLHLICKVLLRVRLELTCKNIRD